ncbi:M56 family metallopeptidase [Candidatus Puniceispirillum marinum]|uniref:Peptidase M56 domain-containing protein n=1 Tax=Puniceispirillum marinum (strain IMCC1322) TaxID=488538 RepID=D5BS77_PUNMI|nr:M56 family metallopeptidase [Candidatus Puniceispirillum marinum]ADE39124.1 hypothetical protein SAR116_0881 [Candidatus Puniceispirillum marinum IMCC1322]
MLNDLLLNELVVNAYIDANLLLFVIFALWWLAVRILSRTGLAGAYDAQLRLLNGVMLAGALCPVVIYLADGIISQYSLNVFDLIVAHYLDGDYEIKPSTMQLLIDAPSHFVRDFVGQSGTFMVTLAMLITAGTVGFLLKAIINLLALRRVLQACHPLRTIGSVTFLISDTVLVPFSTRGLRRRYIVLPEVMLEDMADVRMAISHELQHFRQRDVEWDMALAFLQPLFFWNPAFYLLRKNVGRLREMACDQSLITRRRYDIRAYCECLLRAGRRSMMVGNPVSTMRMSVAFVDIDALRPAISNSMLRQRILALTGYDGRKHGSRLIYMLILVPLVTFTMMSAVMMRSPADWSHDRLMLSTIVNLERLETRNSNNLMMVRPQQ